MANYTEPANENTQKDLERIKEEVSKMSPEQKKEFGLKEKYGTVYKVSVETEEKTITGYFKDIDFKTASAVARMSSSDPLASQKILVQNTIIKEHSDSEILDDWKITISAGQKLSELIELPNASVAKL